MMAPRIIAGQVADINEHSGQWLIVDVGFSNRESSCGVWNGVGKPRVVTFSCLVKLALEEVQKTDPRPLNLLLEAPLSVAFQQNGNPTRRLCDTHGGKHRYWYVNAGATTLIAASYLLRALNDCQKQRKVRLFEGFASFKRTQDKPSNKSEKSEAHKADVRAFINAVWNDGDNARIFTPGKLIQHPNRIESAFHFLARDLIPPVIRINPAP